ncbi:hypothetical protein GLP59_10535 [Sulfitobacter sp. M220]|uniref:hypothetical protein n=1 Tax=Sulfitobacter sp. M220 TaxID=2675333 RepID=UPI001F3087C7|nr:hypothetical protein [Sulfitobacter sp. M220]MCF7778076.1 hypothetical protein [Sulfitobacter sp. M220]
MTRSKKTPVSKASETKEAEAAKPAAPVVENATEASQPTPENGVGETKATDAAKPLSLAADQASEVAQSVAESGWGEGKLSVPATDLEGLSAALTSDAKPSSPTETRAEAVGSLAAALQPRDEEDLIVVVIGPKGGFWRAGRHFTPEPTRILASELSDEEAAMLRDEPKLAISLMKADAAE